MNPVNSDDIRAFVKTHYIEPARKAGQQRVIVRAGDVHSQLKLASRLPQVCGALGAQLFERDARVKVLTREGPQNGANLRFTFAILP